MPLARRKVAVKSKLERAASARRAAADSRSPKTRRQYNSNWRGWEDFASACDYTAMPASAEHVIEYLAGRFYDADCSASTVGSDIAAINDRHRAAGYTVPGQHPDVRAAMRGIRRAGKRLRPAWQAEPMTLDLLDALPAWINPMHRAWLEIGFSAALRIGEGAALNVGDLQDGQLHIRESKTDQEGEGAWVRLSKRAQGYAEWCAAGLVDDAPLFRSRKGKRCAPVTLARWVRESMRAHGVSDVKAWTGHSLRRGCAQEMDRRGVPLSEIKTHGRWESEVVLMYLQGADTARAVEVLDD